MVYESGDLYQEGLQTWDNDCKAEALLVVRRQILFAMMGDSRRLGPVVLFLLFAAGPFVAATNDGPTSVQKAQETTSVGDLGYVMQLAVKAAVTQALQDQGDTNQALQDELRDLRAEIGLTSILWNEGEFGFISNRKSDFFIGAFLFGCSP
jgi:hypothetical protein